MRESGDLVVVDEHGAHRHVAVLERALRFAQREPHEVLVALDTAVVHSAS